MNDSKITRKIVDAVNATQPLIKTFSPGLKNIAVAQMLHSRRARRHAVLLDEALAEFDWRERTIFEVLAELADRFDRFDHTLRRALASEVFTCPVAEITDGLAKVKAEMAKNHAENIG